MRGAEASTSRARAGGAARATVVAIAALVSATAVTTTIASPGLVTGAAAAIVAVVAVLTISAATAAATAAAGVDATVATAARAAAVVVAAAVAAGTAVTAATADAGVTAAVIATGRAAATPVAAAATGAHTAAGARARSGVARALDRLGRARPTANDGAAGGIIGAGQRRAVRAGLPPRAQEQGVGLHASAWQRAGEGHAERRACEPRERVHRGSGGERPKPAQRLAQAACAGRDHGRARGVRIITARSGVCVAATQAPWHHSHLQVEPTAKEGRADQVPRGPVRERKGATQGTRVEVVAQHDRRYLRLHRQCTTPAAQMRRRHGLRAAGRCQHAITPAQVPRGRVGQEHVHDWTRGQRERAGHEGAVLATAAGASRAAVAADVSAVSAAAAAAAVAVAVAATAPTAHRPGGHGGADRPVTRPTATRVSGVLTS